MKHCILKIKIVLILLLAMPLNLLAVEDLTHTCEQLPGGVSNNQYCCDLTIGTYQYTFHNHNDFLVLTNNSEEYLQIKYVKAIPVCSWDWGEYCVYLDDFMTGQNAAGVGEVGCIHKENYECGYSPVTWGSFTELSVPPGSDVYIGSTCNSLSIPSIIHIETSAQSCGVLSYRQPKIDAPLSCNGLRQCTVWGGWQNTTGGRLVVGGATIYAVDTSVQRPRVDAGCLYILDINQNVRWAYCDQVNTRGVVNFPDQVVEPWEWITGGACNMCAPSSSWNWAAYIHVWYY